MERDTAQSNDDNPLLQLGIDVSPVQSLHQLQHVDYDTKNAVSTS